MAHRKVGTFMTLNNEYASPIINLSDLLNTAKVPHSCNPIHDGLQLRFDWCDGDVVCHFFSYGHEFGFVETWGFPWDEDDVTSLSVEECYRRICDYYGLRS